MNCLALARFAHTHAALVGALLVFGNANVLFADKPRAKKPPPLAGADKPKPKNAAKPPLPVPQLSAFRYHGVTIEPGLLRVQVDRVHRDYLRIPNDELLKGFRRRAGRPAPGADLGGWYTGDVFHVFGQLLSGLARLYAVTGDVACRNKAEALLAGWAECIEKDGFFYYSRKPNAPHYIYDKMVGGLTDMIVHCRSKPAAQHLARITTWAEKHLNRTKRIPDGGEWYTLSENLYRAADATGDRRYRVFAAVWHYDAYGGCSPAAPTRSPGARTASGMPIITLTVTSTPWAAPPRPTFTAAAGTTSIP
jgi:hypothetical protein